MITAGAVEVNQHADTSPVPKTNPPAKATASSVHRGPLASHRSKPRRLPQSRSN